MKHILDLLKIARPFHKYLILLSVLIIISSVLDLSGTVVMKFVVDEIEKQVRDQTGDLPRIYLLLAIMFGFSLSGMIINIFNMRIGDYVGGRIGRYLTEKFYQKIFTLPQKYFDSKISGKIVNQLSRGIVSLQGFLGNMTNFLFPTLVQTIFIIGVLLYYNWIVAVLAFLIFPVYLWVSRLSTKRWGIHQTKKNVIEDETRGRIAEVIANIKLVRSFNMQEKEWDFVSKRLKKSVSIYDTQSKEYHFLNFIRNFGLEIGLIAIAWIVFRQTFLGILTFGELVLMFQLFNQLRRPLFAMSFILEQIKQAETGSKEFFEILNLPSAESFAIKVRKPTLDHATLSFDNVSFEYSEGETVLKNVSFSIKHGETIALVGHSGAGKTTITNLILKFYDPTSGSITINGTDYADVSHQDIRSNVALVFQDSELFSSTIRENVSYGKPNATDEEIKQALKKANAYDFIMKFPKKLDTEIGERGIKLSGGQKQRVQIARAILHDAPILILDEATSSLDAKSEKQVQEALDNLMKNRLVIIIAHRFSTIQDADRIIVIDNGKIVDTGNPQELATKKGIYSELLQYQIEGNRKLLEKYELH